MVVLDPALTSLKFVADFADDGIEAGTPEAILNRLHEEIQIARQYGLKFNFGHVRHVMTGGRESIERVAISD